MNVRGYFGRGGGERLRSASSNAKSVPIVRGLVAGATAIAVGWAPFASADKLVNPSATSRAGPIEAYVFVPPTDTRRGSDPSGCGEYHCPRNGELHRALDFAATPGQPIRAPIDGIFESSGVPYDSGPLTLMRFRSHDGAVLCRLLYIVPSISKGSRVKAGDIVGIAQDPREYHRNEKNMRPHAHVDCTIAGVRVDPEHDPRFLPRLATGQDGAGK